jgi:hypothetical protein
MANLRIGASPIVNELSDAGRSIRALLTPKATPAAQSQMINQCERNAGSEQRTAASVPTMPDAKPAEPGTANEAAASIDARM